MPSMSLSEFEEGFSGEFRRSVAEYFEEVRREAGYVEIYPCLCFGGDTCFIVRTRRSAGVDFSYKTREAAEEALADYRKVKP